MHYATQPFILRHAANNWAGAVQRLQRRRACRQGGRRLARYVCQIEVVIKPRSAEHHEENAGGKVRPPTLSFIGSLKFQYLESAVWSERFSEWSHLELWF